MNAILEFCSSTKSIQLVHVMNTVHHVPKPFQEKICWENWNVLTALSAVTETSQRNMSWVWSSCTYNFTVQFYKPVACTWFSCTPEISV
jgi:hypothetical protein